MANIKSSKKDIRRTRKRQELNAQKRARLRTYDKKVRILVEEGKFEEAREAFREYTSYLDRAGKTNLIHHARASRKKSRIAQMISKASAAKAS